MLERRRLTGREPQLTVVIPVYNVANYLRECLDSALASAGLDLEVVAVDDGSTDDSHAILAEYAARDPRVRVFSQTNSGQGIARNLGVTKARGRFLTFLDADDTVPPQAYQYMVSTLEQTGSDFAVGSARRMLHGRLSPLPWTRVVHQSDHLATTLDEFPVAMQDVIACNRVFRTEFWVERVGEFRGHTAYEDHVPMLTAYVRARKFDVLSGATYNWRRREDRTSTSQQKAELRNLLDRIAVKQEAHELLISEASDLVYDAWVARALEVDFPPFVGYALAADAMYRNVLSAAYRTFLGRTSPAALEQVSFFQKLRAWLVAESRWTELEQTAEFFRLNGRVPRVEVRDGAAHPVVPAGWTFLQEAPEGIRTVGSAETRFEAALDAVRWVGERRIELTGWAMIAGVDATDSRPATTATLVDVDSCRTVPLDLTPTETWSASRWARQGNAAYRRAGFATVVDLDALTDQRLGEGRTWALQLEVDHFGLVRSGRVRATLPGSGAVRPAVGMLLSYGASGGGPPVMVRPVLDSGLGFVLRFEPVAAEAGDLEIVDRTLRGSVTIHDPELRADRVVARAPGARDLIGALRKATSGTTAFSLSVPSGPPRAWELLVDGPDGEAPLRSLIAAVGRRGRGRICLSRARSGAVRLHSDAPTVTVLDVRLSDDTVDVLVRLDGVEAAELAAARMANPALELPRAGESTDRRGTTLRFARRVSRLGGPTLPAPAGDYDLSLPGDVAALRMAEDLLDRLPLECADAEHRLRCWWRRTGELGISLGAPLADDEVGNIAQRRLQSAFRAAEPDPRDGVLLQCYRGEFATDSQAAIDELLQKRHPELTRYWGVADLSTPLPEGAVPVLFGSREWYDALGATRYLCNNVDFDGFFVKRPFQRYLQTFHGYPFKSMGISFWEGKGWGPDRIGAELDRRNAQWDQILVPSPVCEEFYRREYHYEGEVLVTGYPRTDFLVNADAADVRRRVLKRLGVPEDKTVVLYAPTYRDELTTRVFAAKIFDELDLPRLTAALGDDYVLLLRGHNNNQRETDRRLDVARVVDVTDYPEINELTLAADVAVLDYSSLRFDWALTGKPMVFFVPDLDEYFGARPPLFDFEATAPGPLVRTTAAVAEALRDLDAVRRDHEAAMRRFNEEFNALHDGHATERVLDAFIAD